MADYDFKDAIKATKWGATWEEKDVECVNEAMCKIAETLEQIAPVVQMICNTVMELANEFMKAKNKRVAHLALHGKKWRTRKKNRNRLIKNALRRK